MNFYRRERKKVFLQREKETFYGKERKKAMMFYKRERKEVLQKRKRKEKSHNVLQEGSFTEEK